MGSSDASLVLAATGRVLEAARGLVEEYAGPTSLRLRLFRERER